MKKDLDPIKTFSFPDKAAPQKDKGNGENWLIVLIKTLGRIIRPNQRKRTIHYEKKEISKDGYTETKFRIDDEY